MCIIVSIYLFWQNKSTESKLKLKLMKAMRCKCTTILRNSKSNIQKSGNVRKDEVINTPGY